MALFLLQNWGVDLQSTFDISGICLGIFASICELIRAHAMGVFADRVHSSTRQKLPLSIPKLVSAGSNPVTRSRNAQVAAYILSCDLFSSKQ